MSANSTIVRDRNFLRAIAGVIFRQADLGYRETIVDESFAVHQKVLGALAAINYDGPTLIRLGRECQALALEHFEEWMSQAKSPLETSLRKATYALVLELQVLLGHHPLFKEEDDWIFLGRFRRDFAELPMATGLTTLTEEDRMVDLWGRPDGKVVLVRGWCMGDRVRGLTDERDSHAREAFRRLGKEVAS